MPDTSLNNRLVKTCKPQQLPLENDITIIQRHTLKRMQELSGNSVFVAPSNFLELWYVLVTRLTLLNARRGGETCQMTINDWHEAESDS